MKNLKHISKRALALLLTLVMCLGMVNVTVLAEEADPASTEVIEDVQIVEGTEGTGNETDVEDQTGTETGTDVEDQTDADVEDQTNADADVEDQTETDADTDAENQAETDAEDQIGTDADAEDGTETETDAEDQNETDADADTDTDAEGETKVDGEENEVPEAVQAFLTAMMEIQDLQESDAEAEDVLAAVEAAEAAYDALTDGQKADETVAGMYEALVAFKETMLLDETPAEPKSVASLSDLQSVMDGNKLTKDIIVTAQIDEFKSGEFILDLNGHTIEYGMASGSGAAIFRVDGGTLTIRDTAGNGKLQGNSNDNTGSLVKAISGTFKLEGGTLAGHHSVNDGAAIFISNGTVVMSGGTISDCTAAGKGTVYVGENGTLEMSGEAAISGSGQVGAGNMVVTEGTFNMSGGTISGGVSDYVVGTPSKWNPGRTVGGGVCVLGGTFTMTGGTISDNKAEAGGGIYVESGATLNIYGGSILENEATGVKYEPTDGPGNMGGGGIWINGAAVIDPLHDPNKPTNEILIKGNKSLAKRDLGGGGIYVNSNTGSLSLKNAVITENHAYGLGGGLASCVDGSVMLVDVDGAAIFGNISDKNVAQIKTAGDTPTDGHLAWENNANFKDDATDILCASREVFGGKHHGALISNVRFDGQEHDWVGWSYESDGTPDDKGHTGFNVDPVRISAEKKNNGVIYGSYALGLRALNTAGVNYSGGKVIISGNYSDSHGGGIACNGVLNLGFVPENTVKAVSGILELDIAKEVKDESGNDTQMVGKDGFTFRLLDKNLDPIKVPETEDEVTGTTDASGKAVISYKDLVKAEAKDYIFYVQEVEGTNANIIYDTAVYKVTLKVDCSSRKVELKDGEIWTLENYSVTSKTYTKGKITDGTWTADVKENAESLSFTNICKSTGALTIEKTVEGLQGGELEKKHTFIFTVKAVGDALIAKVGNEKYGDVQFTDGEATVKIEVTGNATEKVIIPGLPTGQYEVVEDKDNAQISGYTLNVEDHTPVNVTTEGATSKVTNSYSKPPENPSPDPTTTSLTVKKVWKGDDENVRPTEIKVQLLRNGEPYGDVVTLSASEKDSENWQHKWTGLSTGYTWSVDEVEVPEGYTREIKKSGTTWTITNTYGGGTDIPENPTPTTKTLSVKKVWLGDAGAKRPDSVTVQIFKDNAVVETVTLSSANDWSWSKVLSEEELESKWAVGEINVPEGYTSSVSADGTSFIVTNSYRTTDIPKEPTPPTDVPDNPPPLVNWPDNPPPLVDWPPVVEVPVDPVPAVPAEPEVDIPEDPTPMVGVPQTGDISLAWYAVAILSACGLIILMLRKRKGEEK